MGGSVVVLFLACKRAAKIRVVYRKPIKLKDKIVGSSILQNLPGIFALTLQQRFIPDFFLRALVHFLLYEGRFSCFESGFGFKPLILKLQKILKLLFGLLENQFQFFPKFADLLVTDDLSDNCPGPSRFEGACS